MSPTAATLVAGATQTFVATVTNDSANAGVTWTASVGSITSGGVYTAPTPVTAAAATATITATSKTDTTKTATATVTLTPIAVSVAPPTATLIGGATQTFTATVTGDATLNQGVTWTASTGSITSGGVYTAPAVITTTSATVTATSKTDPSKSASATVTLTPIAVSVLPTTVTLAAGATQTFAATVTSDAGNAGVTWTASVGTITAGGLYTAPTPVAAATATVTATSKTDPTKTATATVTLTPIAVSVAPGTATLIGGATQTFTATVTGDATLNQGVTWTASTGSITSGGLYTAPAVITTTSATVTATSKTDPSKSSGATITLTPISVNAISPATVGLGSGGSQSFTDTVANDGSSSGVSWSIGGGVGTLTASTSTGVTYNAPATVISAVTTVTLTATSVKDPTKSTTATITLNPVSLTIAPTSPVAMVGGATQAFTATVANDGSNLGVTWTVVGGGGFSTGSTASGVATTYTAASPVTTATAVVTATSVKDPSKTASATIPLNAIGVSFSTATTGIVLDAGQTLALTAAVANDSSASGASFVATGAGTVLPSSASGNSPATVLTATGTVTSSVTVTASSVKDPTKSATTATITVNPGLSITTIGGGLPTGTVGTVYPTTSILSASGGTGTRTFAIATGALPAGLVLNSSTGAISGTPTGSAGTSTFTFKVTDSATTPVTLNSGSFSITVNPAPLVWTAPATGTFTYTVGTAITPIPLTTTGGTGAIIYSLNSGTLPAGLSIVGNQVVGTPTAPTVVPGNAVTFLATDSATPTAVTAVSATVTLVANPVTLAITSSALPTGTVGAAYSYQLTSTGGTGAIVWSLNSGSLTGTGLGLSGTGLISGTPTATQTGLSLTFQATDSATSQQQTKTVTLALNVSNALTITTTNTSLPFAYSGQAFPSTTLVAAGGTSPYTWTVTSGATGTNSLATLNLSVSSGGVITGTPATTGTANFTVQVMDSASHTFSMSYTITAYTTLSLPAPNPGSLGAAMTSASYSGSISATGGVSPYVWTVNGSAVPTNNSAVALSDGLSVFNTGSGVLTVSGTPSSVATVSFTAKVTDSANNTAGPFTYTVAVSTTYSVSGQIVSTAGCSNSGLNGITVSINTTPVQTTTTSSGGNFSFSNVPNGTYTVTPSITGPSAVFYPATQSVTVSGSNVPTSFFATLGYTVSGTVAYSGTKTGRIYLALNNNTCGGGGSPGTSIASAGAFTIHGVAPGTYTLQAFLDNLGTGNPNASNPTGSTGSVTLTTANLTGQNVTLSDPATVTLSTAPSLSGVGAFNTGAIAQYQAITNSNGVEMPTSYTLQWSTSSSFTTIAGSKTFPANGKHVDVWFLNGLTNGSIYYFRAYATSAGTATSPYSSTSGPLTIGAPTGGNTVTGAVSFTGSASGPLYVGFYDQTASVFYGEYIASPVSPQVYTVQVPTGTNYQALGLLDQNSDGEIDTGDINNVTNGNNNATLSITGATSNENLTLPSANGIASVTTQNYKSISSGGSSQNYYLAFQVNGLLKLPVAVTLTTSSNSSGANAPTPVDIAACGGASSSCGQGFQINFSLGSVVPKVNDTYTFNVTYSDGTTGTVTATVSAVLTNFVSSLSPTTGTSTSTTPTFTWTDPTCSGCSSYLYSFNLNDQSGNTIWQIPGNNSNSNGFSNSITSLTWNVDPTGGGSTTTVTNLSTSTTYSWQIQAQDSNGNSAVTQVQYQP